MDGSGTTLSIVVATCNQLNSLKFTLLALRDQMPDISTEIIVVDNASSDGTAQFLVDQGENGALRVLINTENIGRTRARNEGANASKGRFIMFLDPGVVCGPGWWISLISTLQMDPQVGAVAGKILIPDGRIDHAGLALLEWGSTKGSHLSGRSINAGRMAAAGVADQSLQVQGLAGEALMVRASAFFAAGGFNTQLGIAHQVAKPLAEGEPAGLDFSLRLKERGWDCVYRAESIMTRLRLSERHQQSTSTPGGNGDPSSVTDCWLGRVRPDFIVVPGKGTNPTSQGIIRPYVEPVIAFSEKFQGGMVNQDIKKRSTASIIVLTENTLSQTRICLNALLAHTEQYHEIILVDNGSTDGTAEYLQDLAEGHDQIMVIQNGKTLGFAGGNNVGIAASTGSNVVLLHSDVVVTAGWLGEMLDAAERNPRAGLLGPMTNKGEGLQNLAAVPYDENNMRGLTEYSAAMAEQHKGQVDKATRLNGLCLLIKRELIARIGGLDERFSRGIFEDNDYCLRAMAAGYEALIVRSCFVHHFADRSMTGNGLEFEEEILGQWELFKAKWGLPVGTSIVDPFDMRSLLQHGFEVSRHYCALPSRAGQRKRQPWRVPGITMKKTPKVRETLGTLR